DPYQAARARDIRRQNSRQSPLYMIAAQDAPPRLGEIECSYSTLMGPCPAMRASEMGQKRRLTHAPTTSSLHRKADIFSVHRHVSKGPTPDILMPVQHVRKISRQAFTRRGASSKADPQWIDANANSSHSRPGP